MRRFYAASAQPPAGAGTCAAIQVSGVNGLTHVMFQVRDVVAHEIRERRRAIAADADERDLIQVVPGAWAIGGRPVARPHHLREVQIVCSPELYEIDP